MRSNLIISELERRADVKYVESDFPGLRRSTCCKQSSATREERQWDELTRHMFSEMTWRGLQKYAKNIFRFL